ncbi:DUF1564 domain-containing protein [Leptospira yasudae]|uniref:DUF1564 domain-containing protein n=1 Tax=Leptospira yasudae TaxID=2202201 RepID=A0ABX9M0I6_9LEPT|nr:DUF1564 domain-containing protein [Leptospira yasudae]RHX78726.1 DUF1564 domain-containing protein [Leptospira yasudae]
MGYMFLNTDHEIRSQLQDGYSITVTLLIPEQTLRRFSERDAKKLPKRIPELLRRYGKYMSAAKRIGKDARRTLYQPCCQGKNRLVRVNARISTGSWTFLGTLAQAHGVSRCFLFNYLLWLEELGVGDSIVNPMNEGVPTFHRYYSYILHLDLLENRAIRKLECGPDPYFLTLDYRDWFPS